MGIKGGANGLEGLCSVDPRDSFGDGGSSIM